MTRGRGHLPADLTAVPDLPEVVRVADALASGRLDYDDCMDVVLAGLRERLGFDVTFVGTFDDTTRTFRSVSQREGVDVVQVGGCDPLEDSYCARVADGRLPEFLPDAGREPSVQQLSGTRDLPVGTHLSVPIRFSDGHVYGTLCGFTFVPDPELRERDLGVMRLLARLLARHLEGERLSGAAREAVRDDVSQVLDRGGPSIVYQPVRDLTTLALVGYEALSRFEDDAPPDQWFTRAATVGLGVELEVAAVRRALSRLDRTPAGVYLAVNLSAAALCSPDLPHDLASADMTRVVVELTEQTGVPDYDEMRRRVEWLHRRGGRVAIDDAGTGHSGLQRILEMSPDVIKLDRTLVHDVAVDDARQAMVAALTWFARRTGATLVAEGVESRDEVGTLRDLGVPYGQGYHLGRPARLSA